MRTKPLSLGPKPRRRRRRKSLIPTVAAGVVALGAIWYFWPGLPSVFSSGSTDDAIAEVDPTSQALDGQTTNAPTAERQRDTAHAARDTATTRAGTPRTDTTGAGASGSALMSDRTTSATSGDGTDPPRRPEPGTRTASADSARSSVGTELDTPADEVLIPDANRTAPQAVVAAERDTFPDASSRASNAAPSERGVSEATPATDDIRVIAAARRLIDAGNSVAARTQLNRALRDGALTSADAQRVRGMLRELAEETIFSKRVFDNDPLVARHEVQSGDVLARIAPKYRTPWEIIAEVNGINPSRIRVGQQLKVLRGPFHIEIDVSEFRLDLFLQDTYLRSYRVALGRDFGTPLGTWKVTDRLPHPTYYPPASADEKRTIPPGDPDNPLGAYWIGLEGTAGDAVGQESFGIHGTNEPESIGQAVSLGCVRMLNDEVELIYHCLVSTHSTVKTLP